MDNEHLSIVVIANVYLRSGDLLRRCKTTVVIRLREDSIDAARCNSCKRNDDVNFLNLAHVNGITRSISRTGRIR
jgi:hypothetical protein